MDRLANLPNMLEVYIQKRKEVRHSYRKGIATCMRREGFKFHPILKDESKEQLSRCNYRFSLNITDDNHLCLQIEIAL